MAFSAIPHAFQPAQHEVDAVPVAIPGPEPG